MTLQSTINNSSYFCSDENDVESDPKSDQVVVTHTSDGKKIKFTDTDTTNRNSPHKLLINRLIPDIIPVFIPPINQMTTDWVADSGGTFHAVSKILSKDIVTDAARSAARVFKDPLVVNWKATDGMIPQDRNTVGIHPILTTPVRIGDGPYISATSIRIKEVESPSWSIVPQEVRNTLPFDTYINGERNNLLIKNIYLFHPYRLII